MRGQTKVVIDHLLSGKSISQLEATELCGTIRLGSIIHQLRHKYQYNIETTEKSVKNRYGTISTYAIYRLVEDEK